MSTAIVTSSVTATDDTDILSQSDRQIVDRVADKAAKFLDDVRDDVIEVKRRWKAAKDAGTTFLGYSDWGTFALAEWHYSGRHMNRVALGEGLALPAPKKRQLDGKSPLPKKRNSLIVEEGLERKAVAEYRRGVLDGAHGAVLTDAGTTTKTFYAWMSPFDTGGDFTDEFDTLEDLRAFLTNKRYGNRYSQAVPVRVDAVYTVTPCELPPAPPKPKKPASVTRGKVRANNDPHRQSLDRKKPGLIETLAAETLAVLTMNGAVRCRDCHDLIEPPIDGIKHGRIDQCEACGRKCEVEKVVGVPITNGKTDYAIEIGLPSEGYGESLKHSQKKLA